MMPYPRLEDLGKQTDDGAPPVPSNFTTITPLVMTPHCHAPSCIRCDHDDRHNRHCTNNITIIFNPRVMRFWFLNVMTTDEPEEASCYCNCDGGRQEFWNADTGEIICNMTAAYGDEK